MKIAIVGGGTAGFVTALILKHTYPKFQISMIRSKKIGTIGVGEGTTEHWNDFMRYIGINNSHIIKHCDATYKAGILFENWGEHDYMQTVESNLTEKFGDINFMYMHLLSLGVSPKELVFPLSWNSEVALAPELEENIKNSPTSQYHFNTEKLNQFLTELAENRGIIINDDEIKNVRLNSAGNINYIEGNKKYFSDFFVDCTGFKRLLISKVGGIWNSYSNDLKTNTAIVFPTENDDYPMYTLARAMDAGWMFRIPVYGKKGNGYVFDRNFITEEQAKKEVENYLGYKIEVKKTISFDPGSLKNPWIKNCCAIGLSANFVEPLEASSIGTSIQQAFLLVTKILNYNEKSIKQYNKEVNVIMENIKDFVQLHYMTGRTDTDFWKSLREMSLPMSLCNKLDLFQSRMPVDDDLKQGSSRTLFLSANWFIVMYGLGLIDCAAYKEQYNNFPDNIKAYAKQSIEHIYKNLKSLKTIRHKTIIDLVREY
jgi:tryptophan halogenase